MWKQNYFTKIYGKFYLTFGKYSPRNHKSLTAEGHGAVLKIPK